MQHKIFFVREVVKTESATAIQCAFRLRFNIQTPSRKSICHWIHNLSKEAVCVHAKSPADHVYQRRTWDEFKTVLSVAQASQPVERAENLEYRNQLSGVCWGAVYCSSPKDLRSDYIFLNHAVYLTIFDIPRFCTSHICMKMGRTVKFRKTAVSITAWISEWNDAVDNGSRVFKKSGQQITISINALL